jgi:hypothetical protein
MCFGGKYVGVLADVFDWTGNRKEPSAADMRSVSPAILPPLGTRSPSASAPDVTYLAHPFGSYVVCSAVLIFRDQHPLKSILHLECRLVPAPFEFAFPPFEL